MSNPLPAAGLAERDRESLAARNRLAVAISNVLSPPVLVAPILALGVWLSDVPGTWRYAALYLAIAVLVPLGDLVWLLHRGKVSDFHLAQRGQRTRPFLVSILCTTASLLLLVRLDAPRIFIALVQAALLQAVLLFLITLFWQVSIHTATVAGFATLAVLALGSSGLALLLLVPVVGWARVHLRRHTVAQTIAGAAIGSGTLLVSVHGLLW